MSALPVIGLQRSVEWLLQRVGKVTASRFKDIVGTTAKREGYLWDLVIERITGNPTDHYASSAMAWGTEQEPFARMRYESVTGAIVEEAGFVLHPDIPDIGGSPDGLIDSDGGIEVKCPFNSANHLKTILDGMPNEHQAQVQGILWITGRKWWDFVSFDPRLPVGLDLHIQRIERDEEFIAQLAASVAAFIVDIDATIARLQPPKESAPEEILEAASASAPDPYITPDQCADLEALCSEFGLPPEALKKAAKVERLSHILAADYERAIAWVKKPRPKK